MVLLSFETVKLGTRGPSYAPLHVRSTQGYTQAAQGSLSGSQDGTATAQNSFMTAHVKWRDARASK